MADRLRDALTTEQLERLRQAYDHDAKVSVGREVFVEAHPDLAPWVDGFTEVFFSNAPLAPRDRERCVIALLAARSVPVSLAVHVYWGLMEGLDVDEVLHTVALSAAYTGIPTLGGSLGTVHRLVRLLASRAEMPLSDRRAEVVVREIGRTFAHAEP